MGKHTDDIIARYINNLYTQADSHALFDIVQSDTNRQQIEEAMDKVWNDAVSADTERQTEHEQYKAEALRLLRRIRKPGKEKMLSLRPLLRYAAVFVLFMIVGFGIYVYTTQKAVNYVEINVGNGEHKRMSLPDGTHIILNAGTSIRYPESFKSDTRWVEINGEAFFEVKKSGGKPFMVYTKEAWIKVLGTSFNVKAYDTDEQLMVSVQTGKVQVDIEEAMMRLHPDEQFVWYKSNGEYQKRNENIRLVKSWIEGGLYFNRTPIKSVVKELERIYNCKIEFMPGGIYDEYIYGEHDNKNLESVLKSIQYSTGIRYKKEGNNYTLYRI
ncbi:MAG: FecR domain-containing protein [Tannerellaceae bacterium]|nr:FecR domain-containing protein [Tannerellaceae bacterium]